MVSGKEGGERRRKIFFAVIMGAVLLALVYYGMVYKTNEGGFDVSVYIRSVDADADVEETFVFTGNTLGDGVLTGSEVAIPYVSNNTRYELYFEVKATVLNEGNYNVQYFYAENGINGTVKNPSNREGWDFRTTQFSGSEVSTTSHENVLPEEQVTFDHSGQSRRFKFIGRGSAIGQPIFGRNLHDAHFIMYVKFESMSDPNIWEAVEITVVLKVGEGGNLFVSIDSVEGTAT